MQRKSRSPRPFYWLLLALALVALVAVGCSSDTETEPEAAAPTAAAPEAAAPAAPAESAAPAAAPADDYQASREACTADSPCWPSIVDTVPSSFHEAPMLAEKVAAGELPPVEERIPVDPLVIQPAEDIGQYGGTLRRAFTGPGDRQNIERYNNDYRLFWNTGATEIVPRAFKSWSSNDDATEWTFTLREGMKWSDGEPYTVDDYMFWYEHILLNGNIITSVPWYLNWGGDLVKFEKVDDLTLKMTFAAPFPLWLENLASSTVAGHFQNGRTGLGLVAPAHYLEQFHPDFVGEEEANKKATEAGFESWNLYFLAQNDSAMNPELPVTTPWVPVTRVADSEFVLERNPYFFAVDTEGNQLPYFDGISLELVEELEVLNLRAIAGNYTVQGRHIDFAKLPVIRENQAAGNYFVDFWGSSTRNPVAIYINQDWNEDPEIAAFTVGSVDFRQALSLALDRDELNETFFLGVGTPSSLCPANTPPFFNSDRWDEKFARFAPDEANTILDSIGLDKKDADGFRLLPSGKRLSLRLDAVSGSFLDYPAIGERIAQMWAENIGVELTINPVERSLWIERTTANQPMGSIFETGEFNPTVLPRLIPDIREAPVATVWGNTPNPDPAEYDGTDAMKAQILKHWEAMQETDPEKRMQLFIEGTEIMCDAQARLGVVVDVPVYTTLIKNNVHNVPKPMEWVVYAQTPGNGYPETFYEVQE